MPLAATLIAPRKIELRKRDALQPESREVVIAVEHAGVCGTDLALFSGDLLRSPADWCVVTSSSGPSLLSATQRMHPGWENE